MRIYILYFTLLFLLPQVLFPYNNKLCSYTINSYYDSGEFCNLQNWRGFYLNNICHLENSKSKFLSQMIDYLESKYELTDILIGLNDSFINNFNNEIVKKTSSGILTITGVSYRFNYNKEYDYLVIICFKFLQIKSYRTSINNGIKHLDNSHLEKLLKVIQETSIDSNTIIYEGLIHKPIPIPDADAK